LSVGTFPPITTVSYLTAIVHPDRQKILAFHAEFEKSTYING
jgi:hypothetical protein